MSLTVDDRDIQIARITSRCDTPDSGFITTETDSAALTGQMPERFRMYTISEIEELRAGPMLIEGLIPANSSALLAGPTGSYKTFITTDIGLHVSAGKKWHGREVLEGPVIQVVGEGASAIGKRLRAWRCQYQIDRPQPFFTITEAPQMTKSQDIDDLLRQIEIMPEYPVLIILDTLARCFVGGEENSARDMGAFVAGVDRLRRETGAAVMVVHHTGKNGELRGSSSLLAAADTAIETRRTEGFVTLRCVKQKDHQPFPDFSLVRRIVGEGNDSSLIFELGGAPVAGRKLTKNAENALEILKDQFPAGVSLRDWKAAAVREGISDRTLANAKDALLATQQIVEGPTRFYRAAACEGKTENGKETEISGNLPAQAPAETEETEKTL